MCVRVCVCVHVCVCVCPLEYYLYVVGDGQRLLAAELLLQVWTLCVKLRTLFDGITWHSPSLYPC